MGLVFMYYMYRMGRIYQDKCFHPKCGNMRGNRVKKLTTFIHKTYIVKGYQNRKILPPRSHTSARSLSV